MWAGRRSADVASATWTVWFASTLTLGMVVSAGAFIALGILGPMIVEDLAISRTQFGWALAAPSLVSIIVAPLAGRFSDSSGGRATLLCVVCAGAVAALWVAGARSFPWLLAAALFMGSANGASNAGTNKLIATHIAAGNRGWIVGLKQSAQPIVLLVGGVALPWLALAMGWRTAVACIALLAVPALVAVAWLIPSDPAAGRRSPRASPYRHSPMARWLAVYGVLMGMGTSVIFGFVPLYAREALDFSVAAAGAAASLYGAVGVIARVAWARGTEMTTHFARPLGLISVVALLSAVTLWAASVLWSWLLWLGVVGAGASIMAWTSVTMLAVVSRTDTGEAGRASSLAFSGHMAGVTIGPVLFGFAVDRTGSYHVSWLLIAGFFFLASQLAVLWRRLEPLDRPGVPN